MPPLEWAYDASTSRVLRWVSHLPVAGLGGAFLLGGAVVAAGVVTSPTVPDPRVLLRVGLLVLVGGPYSLLYLWPMLTDPAQRPSVDEFAGAEGFPFSLRSVGGAAVLGAVCLAGLLAAGIPVPIVYWLVVAAVFSTLPVAVVTTRGRLDGGDLVVDGTGVPIERVEGVRSLELGGVVLCWVSYASSSGVFLPRLFAVPVASADAVRDALRSGAGRSPHREGFGTGTRIVLLTVGGSFLAVAALAYAAIDQRLVGGYLTAIVGVIGVLFCVAGWRGL